MSNRAWGLSSLLVFCVSAALTGIARTRADSGLPAGASEGAAPNGAPIDSQFRSERELVLVYVGRESCAWCRRPELVVAIDSAVVILQALALAERASFRFFGIGVDLDPQASVKHLRKFRGLHGWSVGDGWNSLTGDLLVSGRLAGPRATPQVIVIVRDKRVAGNRIAGFSEVLSEAIVLRKVGLMEIEEWLQYGAILPAGSLDRKGE